MDLSTVASVYTQTAWTTLKNRLNSVQTERLAAEVALRDSDPDKIALQTQALVSGGTYTPPTLADRDALLIKVKACVNAERVLQDQLTALRASLSKQLLKPHANTLISEMQAIETAVSTLTTAVRTWNAQKEALAALGHKDVPAFYNISTTFFDLKLYSDDLIKNGKALLGFIGS
jgi:hypothetical protein